ncbi:tail fiber assembly protein [Symbiopectobacterium sp. RP]|uniref:tail fiber assembly protein n=1 Tax=Symbiopectobacterium sp. RP TaxID=3248553 RepID=UPI003D28D0EB
MRSIFYQNWLEKQHDSLLFNKALIAWKKYHVLLYRVDVRTAPDIAWPEVPEGEKTGN